MKFTSPCGCKYEKHELGMKSRIGRCEYHRKRWPDQNVFEEKDYRRMGVLAEETNHCAEFIEHFGSLPVHENGHLIEFGCGVSPYVKMISDAGYSYDGVDTSEWAVQYMRGNHSACCVVSTVDDFETAARFDVVLAAHVLEHVPDAFKSVRKFHEVLSDNGLLYLLIPDDEDMNNQDHLWFFTPDSACKLLEQSGFIIERVSVARIVKQENFIYIRARKRTGS